MSAQDLGDELATMLRGTADRLGVQLNTSAESVRQYAAERMLHLSTIVGQPGYQEALVAETTNVATHAAIQAVETADAADREIVGTIAGALAIGARALAGSPA